MNAKQTLGIEEGDYASAKTALEKEASDGDEERVKVYGIMKEDSTIEGRFVEVEGSLYPIYKPIYK